MTAGVVAPMHGRSPSPADDSAESIYNLLCAVQAQASSDEEEIKALRLRITSHEGDIHETREVIQDLQQQHIEARRDADARRLHLREQEVRYAGVVEVLRSTRQELIEAADAFLQSELPIHPAAGSTPAELPQELVSPEKLREVALNLRQEIEIVTNQHHQCSAAPFWSRGSDVSGGPGAAVDQDPGDEAGRPYTVRFRREGTTAVGCTATGEEVEEKGEKALSSSGRGRGRRRILTFNEDQLVECADTTCAAASALVGLSTKECAPVAGTDVTATTTTTISGAGSGSSVQSVFRRPAGPGRPHAPRRTWWRTETRSED